MHFVFHDLIVSDQPYFQTQPCLPQDGLGKVVCRKADAKRHYYKMAVLCLKENTKITR